MTAAHTNASVSFGGHGVHGTEALMGRLKEAASREGMRSVNAWLPEELHRELMRARVEDGIAMSEAIRRAVKAWLAARARRAR